MVWRKASKDRPLIMGVLNVTPDSFFDGGRYSTREKAVSHALALVDEGADIIDVGGESTRPYSTPVEAGEEAARVVPVIRDIRSASDIPLSIDTRKAVVAEQAIAAGASIINDVSGLAFDADMGRVVAQANVPVVIMHSGGRPEHMQDDPRYDDVIGEIEAFFLERLAFAEARGISRDNVIVDPGIGFGKRVEDNLRILKELRRFKALGLPLLVGTSMKTFVGKVTGAESPDERLSGTLATVAVACINGADIIRVHEVRESKRVITMVHSIMGA